MRSTRTTIALAVIAFAVVLWTADRDSSSLKGRAAPDFTFNTLDGDSVQLSREKGNVVLLDYWATWCAPCRASLHHIQKLSQDETRAAEGLKVYAINDQEQVATVERFLQQNDYTFTVPLDPRGLFGRKYKVEGIPTTVIVGRDGIIKDVFIGYGGASDTSMEKAIDEALSESQ